MTDTRTPEQIEAEAYARGIQAAFDAINKMPVLSGRSGDPTRREHHPRFTLSFVDWEEMRSALVEGRPQPDWEAQGILISQGESVDHLVKEYRDRLRAEAIASVQPEATWQYGWQSFLQGEEAEDEEEYEWQECFSREDAQSEVDEYNREEEGMDSPILYVLARRRYTEPGPWERVTDE